MTDNSQLQSLPALIESARDVGIAIALFKSDLGKRILGPLCDHYGNMLVSLSEKGEGFIVVNMGRVLSQAMQKLPKSLSEDSYVAPKIVKDIMEEAMMSTNIITDSYLGGVLASSISHGGRDDRGKVFAQLIARLSTYELRAHYIFYHSVKNLFNGKEFDLSSIHDREKMHVRIPYASFLKSMDYRQGESENICCPTHLIGHVVPGLGKEGLIETDYMFGTLHNGIHVYKPEGNGGVFTPTVLGVELFAWAYGVPLVDYATFLKKEVKFSLEKGIIKPSGCIVVTDLAGYHHPVKKKNSRLPKIE